MPLVSVVLSSSSNHAAQELHCNPQNTSFDNHLAGSSGAKQFPRFVTRLPRCRVPLPSTLAAGLALPECTVCRYFGYSCVRLFGRRQLHNYPSGWLFAIRMLVDGCSDAELLGSSCPVPQLVQALQMPRYLPQLHDWHTSTWRSQSLGGDKSLWKVSAVQSEESCVRGMIRLVVARLLSSLTEKLRSAILFCCASTCSTKTVPVQIGPGSTDTHA